MSQTEASVGQAETSIEWMRDFWARWEEAWHSHQPDQLLALMTEDIEYRDDAWPRPMRGHAEVREFLSSIFTAFPDVRFELVSGPYVLPGEPRAAFHWRGWATNAGAWNPPGFAPTGRRWEGDGADFHEYRDGRICRLRIAFDLMAASRQLGMMPQPGSRIERVMVGAQQAAMTAQQAIRRRSAR